MKLKVGGKVFHRLASEEMIVVGIDKEPYGTIVHCRRYMEKEKKFVEELFRQEELELEKKVSLRFKTPEEELKFVNEWIILHRHRKAELEKELAQEEKKKGVK